MSDRPSDKRVISTQESLQPQRIGKEEKAYQSVLDIEERLQKGDATNIALTGPYGSGKSSILITLKDDFPEHHYLNISLATLKPADLKTQENKSSKDSEDDDCEGKEKEQVKLKGSIKKNRQRSLIHDSKGFSNCRKRRL